MAHLCKHCATPYAEASRVSDFCCAGCEQVYWLIQQEGLGDYYGLRDRASQPLKDRRLDAVNVAALRRSQAEVEGQSDTGQAVFEVEGMSCMACAWLVERLAANQPGLIEATASLSQHTLTLHWRRGAFDLSVIGADLYKFGYRIRATPKDPHREPRLSPLALRFFLTLIFTGNALLLAAFTEFVSPPNDRVTLVSLLSLICLCFTLLLGAAPFCLTVYRAWQIRRWHSDWIPVLVIAGSLVYLGVRVVFSTMNLSFAAFLVSLLVCIILNARVLSKRIH